LSISILSISNGWLNVIAIVSPS